MTPLYIGFFTIGTAYQTEVVECIQTLDAFDLEHEFVGVPNRGSWVRNCAQKPEVIRRMQQKHDGRPLIYLDVDARIRKRPELFERIPPEIDIGCHFRLGAELLSGTLYFGSTAAARELVSAWCDLCLAEPTAWDQVQLQKAVQQRNPNVYRLPPEYVRFFDDPEMGDPVIEHMQASRRLSATIPA